MTQTPTAPLSRGRPTPGPRQVAVATPYIEIKGVWKSFDGSPVVKGVDLEIYKGELFSLLGGSGSGKTTLLRILAGFEIPDKGRILIDGQDITEVPPYERPVNMMFQSYALFPHMSVEKNVAFGLVQDKVPAVERKRRVKEALEMVQLQGMAGRRPHQLSGGQRQRVALARSLVKRPKLLLLDEPLGALDRRLRERTQFEIINIQEQTGITFIMVTHDQEEAMTMSTRMAIMHEGILAQIGAPSEVYESPKNLHVAEFIGDVNLFSGSVVSITDNVAVIQGSSAIGEFIASPVGSEIRIGNSVSVCIRPEKMRIEKLTNLDSSVSKADSDRHENSITGVISDISYTGDLFIYMVEISDRTRVRVTLPNLSRVTGSSLTWEDTVRVSWFSEDGVVLVG